MKKHKILYLDHGSKAIGGGQINTLSLLFSLNKDIFEPIILTSLENNFTKAAREAGIEVDVIPLPKQLTSIGRYSVKYDPYHLFLYALHSLKFLLVLRKYIIEKEVGLLHPCDNLMRIFSGLIAKGMNKPIVCPIMDDFQLSITSRILRYTFLNTMDYVLPVSEKSASFFRGKDKYNHKIVVTHTGIDLGQYTDEVITSGGKERQSLYGDKYVVGVVGRLISLKGHRELFKALNTLKYELSTSFVCLVVGDGPDLMSLKALAVKLSIEKDVVFMGFQHDIPKIMSTMNVVVVPSHEEASSRVVLEAAALKIPSIGTRVGGIPEMISENKTGLLVEQGDISALARAMYELTDESIRQEMGCAGYERVTTYFSNSIITKKIEDIYLKAINNKK